MMDVQVPEEEEEEEEEERTSVAIARLTYGAAFQSPLRSVEY